MTPDDVLAYWIGAPATDAEALSRKVRRWFGVDAAVDQEIRSRFGACHEQALSGELDAWAATPRGRLALIILVDQFTRNLARNTPGAYTGDARAQQLTLDGLAQGADAELSFEELLFFLLPLGHSEELALHERNVTRLER